MGDARIHYLERTTEGGPFVRVRVIQSRDGLAFAEIFELGEPVHLKSIRPGRGVLSGEKIWWIQGFGEVRGQSKVFVTEDRIGTPGELGVPVRELEKLPAMLRIALECSD
jgi:hypothetical protein